MIITLYAAVDRNGVIGNEGKIPWRLPDDQKRFKEETLDKPVVLGRKTYESIGRLLPGRPHIILSRDPAFHVEGATVVASIKEALRAATSIGSDTLAIIGGGGVYSAFLPLATYVHLSEVDAEVDGDVTFPTLNTSEWHEVSREHHAADNQHKYAFDFVVYKRI